jgi:hypothetical protein
VRNAYKVTLSTSIGFTSSPVSLSNRYLMYETGRSVLPSLSSILKCQSVSGQYPKDPTISPRNSQEAPVIESVIRLYILVFFHIHPKRLKKIREV